MNSALPSILDKEIQRENEDLFGHIHYAEVLSQLINNHTPPYTIGILGGWGTGKSSIKKLCKTKFLNDQKKYKIIDFNAWRYESTDVRLSLLKFIYLELKKEIGQIDGEEQFKEELLTGHSETKHQNLSIKEIWNNFITVSGGGILQLLSYVIVLAFFIFLISSGPIILTFFNKLSSLSFACLESVIIFITSIVLLALKNTSLKLNLDIPLFFQKTTNVIPSYNFSIEQERILKNQIQKFIQRYKEKKIIIFIDDLDRLPSKEMLSGIDAIRVFLEMELNNIKSNIIFVISCDETNISKALENEKSNITLNTDSAKNYLDRIFQFRIEIPSIAQENLLEMARSCITKFEKDGIIFDEYFKNNYPKALDVLIHAGIKNPRTAKQLINSFLQSYWIANKREQKCEPCNKNKNDNCKTQPCLLSESTITKNLETLAVISVLKIEFSQFYNDLTKEPDLLKCILYKAFGVKDSYINEDNSILLKQFLYKYLIQNDNTEDSHQNFTFIDKRLQFYLSSVKYIKFPPDLNSFVMLSEDSIAREIGISASRKIMACLQADEHKELENIFTSLEDEKQQDLQTSLLYKAYKQINRKGGNLLHKRNADRSVLAVLKYLKGKDLQTLVNEVAKSLETKLELGDKEDIILIGSKNIKELLIFSKNNNGNILLLFKKILTTILKDGSIELTIDKYNDIINRNWVIDVIDAAIEIIYNNNQCLDSKNSLTNLIIKRQYSIIDKDSKSKINRKIDYTVLEDWLTRHPEILNDIKFEYIEETINAISEQKNKLEVTQHTSNFSKIVHSCWKENSTRTLDFIANCINNNDLANFAFEFISQEKNEKSFNLEQRYSITTAITDRFIKLDPTSFSKETRLIEYLKKSLNKYSKDFYNIEQSIKSQKLSSNLNHLLYSLSDEKSNKENVNFIINVYPNFFILSPTLANGLLEQWTTNLFGEDPTNDPNSYSPNSEIIKMISTTYITDTTREASFMKSLLNTLDENIESCEESWLKQDPDEIVLRNYEILISNLPAEILKSNLFDSHMGRIFYLTAVLYENDDPLFDKLFLIIAPILKYFQNDELDDLFIKLNENLIVEKQSPKTVKLNEYLMTNWYKKTNSTINNYNPQKVFESNKKIINNSNNDEEKLIIYESSKFLLENVLEQNETNNSHFLSMCFQIAKIKPKLVEDFILKHVGSKIGENYYMAYRIQIEQQLREKIWNTFIKYCKKNKKVKLLIEQSQNFLSDNGMKYSSSEDWFKLIQQEYTNNEILFEALFENIKKKPSLLNASIRRKTTKTLEKLFGNKYSKEALNFAKFLFKSENYLYLKDNGVAQNSLLDWIKELSLEKLSDVINIKTVEKLKDKKLKKRIATKFKEKRNLKKFL